MMVTQATQPRMVTEFPCAVKEIEHVWVPMSDGTRLSARIWIPQDAETKPVPAILEYIPYRKRDGTRAWDDPRHRWWAGHGYAAIRLDIRGTGESEGTITDEYTPQEQQDAVEAIAWIAAQPWCTGKVGMTGISWGGFNSLQVAAHRPPALKAIITHCSTDDRYADDIHFMGGTMLVDNFFWGSGFFEFMARQGDPEIQGERWKEQWLARLESWEPVAATIWQEHQRRDAYWKQGSVCENYADITCAVYAVGGWADGYSNAIPRMLANLQCPRKGLVGPWGHKYPQDAIPGPSIGWMQESLRWWDHWLKDDNNGVMNEPMYRVWLDEPQAPDACLAMSRGRWVTEPAWPSGNIGEQVFHLNSDGLAQKKRRSTMLEHSTPLTMGAAGGVWCPYGLGGSSPDLATDQREDDARSLCFDTAPLEERLEVLGAPVVRLRLAIDKEQGMVAVRLNDVAPDGSSLRVSYGLLNLSHRKSHEKPRGMKTGAMVDVEVQLNDLAHAFPAGHRIRVAVSTSYWPMAWPSPESVTMTLATGRSTLCLPVRPPRGEDKDVPDFAPPEMAPLPEMIEVVPGTGTRHVERNMASGEQVVRVVEDGGVYRMPGLGLTLADGARVELSITEGDPTSARGTWTWHSRRTRGDWDVTTTSQMTVTVSREAFHIATDLEAFEGDKRIFARRWNHDVKRDHL
jgi:uncharacterized protein